MRRLRRSAWLFNTGGGSRVDPGPASTLRRARDNPGLDNRGVYGAHGHLGLRPGPDRGRALAGGLRGGRPARRAGRAGPAVRGLALPIRPADRAGELGAARRVARLGPRDTGLPAATADGGEPGRAGRRGRSDPDRRPGPRAGVDRRRGGAPDARRAPAARALPALGDRARAERAAAAVGPDPEAARPLRPVPADQRPRPERGGAERGDRARPPGARRRAAAS